jgi:ubiquitin C-terminal hydrolase
MLQGLANMGNTCSINTMIQCLGHCDLFREFILNNQSIFKKREKHNYSIGEELHMIFKQMWLDKNSLMPIRFLKALQETLGDMCRIGDEQMDFTEVWIFLLQNLLEESHDPNYILDFYKPFENNEEMFRHIQRLAVKTWKTHAKDSHSPILNLLQGTQIQQIECNSCHEMYHNIEPFQCTHLDLEKQQEEITLEDCFNKFFKVDTVCGWKCDKCKNESNEKVVRFWNLPKVWVIILNRFYGMSKLHTSVKIPLHLNFAPGFEMGLSSHSTYQLKCIANHYGSLGGGHYNAMCCNKNNEEWYLYDDTTIQKINDIQPILNGNRYAYALFYERSNID